MITLREAAERALEALEDMLGWESLAPQSVQASSKQSLQRLREALAQPEPEPMADTESDVLTATYMLGLHAGKKAVAKRKPLTLEIHQPNEAGSTLVTARWFVDTPHGWIGAWDREAIEYVIGKKK